MSRATRVSALGVLIVLTAASCASPNRDDHVAIRETRTASHSIGPAQVARNQAAAAEYTAGREAAAAVYAAGEEAALEAQRAELERQGAVLAEAARVVDEATAPPVEEWSSSWDGTGTPCAIPQAICDRESGGDPTLYNTQGSGASGKYQAMPDTWDGYGGYANAADAPEAVQDEWAAALWAGGAGCSHWNAC